MNTTQATTGPEARYGTCPVCNGSGKAPGKYPPHKIATCHNCGDIMSDRASGITRLRADGTPCTHEWRSRSLGSCYTQFYCTLCPATCNVDSSD